MTAFLIFLLLFIIINFIILGMFFSSLEIEIKELNLESNEKRTWFIDVKKANICINLYFFKLIKIFKIRIDEKYIYLFGKRIFLKKLYEKENNKKIILNKLKDVKNNFKSLDFKILRPNLGKFNFKLDIGTENATITSFLTFIIATFLTYILKKSVKTFNPRKYNYKIIPIYSNANYFSANLNSKIKFNTFNLIVFAKQFLNSKTSEKVLLEHEVNNKYKEYGIVR